MYENEQLGFRFWYPQEWGDIKFNINQGATGYAFFGRTNNHEVSFGGISEDFEGFGGPVSHDTTRGYVREGDKFYFRFVAAQDYHNYEIIPAKELSVRTGEQAVILDVHSFPDDKYSDSETDINSWQIPKYQLGVLVNLRSARFPGMYMGVMRTDVTEENFEKLIKSIELFDSY